MNNLLLKFCNGSIDLSAINALSRNTLAYYDVGKQKATNESLTSNPSLTNLAPNAANDTDLSLKNFTFGGLSGIGSYGTDLTKWTVDTSGVEVTRTYNKAHVKINDKFIPNHFRLESNNAMCITLKASVAGKYVCTKPHKQSKLFDSNEVYTVYLYKYTGEGDRWIFFQPDTPQDYDIEILPSYPNSLVFNGTIPTYVFNKNVINVTPSPNVEWVDFKKFKITYQQYYLSFFTDVRGNIGQSLTVSVSFYKVKVSGLVGKQGIEYTTGKSTNDKDFVWEVQTLRNGINTINPFSVSLTPDSSDEYCRVLYNRFNFRQDPIMDWSNTSSWYKWTTGTRYERAIFTTTKTSIHITESLISIDFFQTKISHSVPYRVRITGLSNSQQLKYQLGQNSTTIIIIEKDGEYDLPYDNRYDYFNMSWCCLFTGKCDITIEQIDGCPMDVTIECLPIYPDKAGTKNYGVSQNITGVKSIVMDVTPLDMNSIFYDQRPDMSTGDFAIASSIESTVAYRDRCATNTYINGVLNTNKTVSKVLGHRQIIGINAINASINNLFLGCSLIQASFANMAFNSILLFDRDLTDSEMKAVADELMSGWSDEELEEAKLLGGANTLSLETMNDGEEYIPYEEIGTEVTDTEILNLDNSIGINN